MLALQTDHLDFAIASSTEDCFQTETLQVVVEATVSAVTKLGMFIGEKVF